jgi:hypothetical protein
MIRYLENKLIDRKKWDDCISRSFNGMIYGYTWFLDVVCENWDGLVEDDYLRVFPVCHRKKFGVSIVYQPFFTQQLGLFSQGELNPAVVNDFLTAIPSRFRLVDINLNIHNKPDHPGFGYDVQVNHELDLIGDYEDIRRNYSSNTRRNLAKAEKAGLSVIKGVKPDDIISLFRENRGAGIRVLRDAHYMKLKRLVYTCIYKGLADVYGVYDDHNELCAGAVFLESHKKSIFIFSGLSDKGRDNRAMFLLIDHFIREHAGKHLTLDFDGSNNEALARFYKGFGSERIVFLRISRNTLPLLTNMALKIYRNIR